MATKKYDLEELNNLLGELGEDCFTVAFFVNNCNVSQDEWMRPLARRLNEDSIITIGIATPESANRCDLSDTTHQAVISTADLPKLKNIRVFIISDMDGRHKFPTNSRVLGCTHALDIAQDPTLVNQAAFYGMMDGWMSSFPLTDHTRTAAPQLWNTLVSRAHAWRHNDNFFVIPTGYPRLAVLANELASSDIKADAIVYAPLEFGYLSNYGGTRTPNHDGRIIRVLLNSFPDYKIIFRPYRKDLNSELVQKISADFAGESRFVLDDNPGRLFSFAHGAVLITDYSHIAKSFAFATGRSAIYFRPWEKKGNRPELWAGGSMAFTYSGLVSAVRQALDARAGPMAQIGGHRDELIAPFENTFDDIAGWIRDFYMNKPREEWLVVRRSDQEGPFDVVKAILTMLNFHGPAIPPLASTALNYGDPASHLLAAFALHQGMVLLPDDSYVMTILDVIGNLLGEKLAYSRYGDADPAIVRRLYAQAALDMIRSGNARGLAVTEELQKNFNEVFPESASLATYASASASMIPDSRPGPAGTILDEAQLSDLLRSLPEEVLVVALYVNVYYAAQDEWLNALARHLNDRGYVTIAITTPASSASCHFTDAQYQAEIPDSRIKDLGRINVFIISDMERHTIYPRESRVLGCTHSFYYASGPVNFPESIQFSAVLDGWMIPMRLSEETRRLTKELWTGFVNPSYSNRKDGNMQIIPAGYPRLSAMAEKLRTNPVQPDAILYAPCQMDFGPYLGGERVRKNGVAIIQTLLDNFPQCKVIFRPMPGHDRDNPAFKEILAIFSNEPRFVFDDDPAQYPSFSRSWTVITDASNIVKSFAFLTLRPGIYFMPWQHEVSEPLTRWDGGFNAATFPALIEAVRLAIENTEEERIRKNRDKYLMPLEGALEEIADWLPDFCRGESRPDWLEIERGDAVSVMDENAILTEIGKITSSQITVAATLACYYNNRQSPLLAAAAIHYGLRHMPENRMHMALDAIAGNILGKPMPLKYNEVSPEDVRRLYEMALAEKKARGDEKGLELAGKLLNDFNALFPETA